MNYKQSLEYIEEISATGSILGLDNMRRLCDMLGNPQDKLKFVHVAGTNGKGSVCAFLSSMLTEAGYKTGTYMSPSVFSYNEKIRFGRRNISNADFARLLTHIRETTEKEDFHPTVFEVETALAFLYFAEKECEVVVLECGLGGETDATNIVKNTLLAVITHVALDHMHILGKDIRSIAEKKAGIIKPGSTAVFMDADPVIKDVIVSKCEAIEARYVSAADLTKYISVKKSAVQETKLDLMLYDESRMEKYKGIVITIPGPVQHQNAMLSAQCMLILKERYGFDKIDEKTIRKGLKKTTHPGRFEVISDKPMIVIDGAHNPDAAVRLRESVLQYFKGKRLIFIIGVFADKDYEEVLKIMAPLASYIVTVATPSNPRALPSIELAKTAMKYNKCVTAAASVEEAVEMALIFSEKNDIILSFGSLSYLGLVKKIVENYKCQKKRK